MTSTLAENVEMIGIDGDMLFVEPKKLVDDPSRIVDGLSALNGVSHITYQRIIGDRMYFQVRAKGGINIHTVREDANNALRELLAHRIAALNFRMEPHPRNTCNMLDICTNAELPKLGIHSMSDVIRQIRYISGVSFAAVRGTLIHVLLEAERDHHSHKLVWANHDVVYAEIERIIIPHIKALLA